MNACIVLGPLTSAARAAAFQSVFVHLVTDLTQLPILALVTFCTERGSSLEKVPTLAVDAYYLYSVAISRIGPAQKRSFTLRLASLVLAHCADLANKLEAGPPYHGLLDRSLLDPTRRTRIALLAALGDC